MITNGLSILKVKVTNLGGCGQDEVANHNEEEESGQLLFTCCGGRWGTSWDPLILTWYTCACAREVVTINKMTMGSYLESPHQKRKSVFRKSQCSVREEKSRIY
jgi:hypothetical protein